MSIMKGKVSEESPKKGFSKMIVPLYIALSAIFILYVGYSYLQGVVYRSGAATGQQQGYQAAVVDLVNKVGEKCEAVALTVGETQVDVINVACLQQAAPANQVTPTVPETTEEITQ